MKKRKLISLVLSFALVFTTVFASAGSVFAGTVTNGGTKASSLTSKSMLYSTTKLPAYKSYTVGAGGGYAIVPVKASTTGWMYIDGKASIYNDCSLEAYLVDKYSYDTDTGEIEFTYNWSGYGNFMEGQTQNNELKRHVTQGKTYYVLMETSYSSEKDAQINLRAKIYTTKQRSVSASTSKYTIASGCNSSGNYGKATYFKLKAEKSGVMRVYVKEYGYTSSNAYVTLYNSNKKTLSEEIYYSSAYSDNRVYFGVKKGRTYYLKISSAYGDSKNNEKYGVRYTISKLTDKNYVKKSKAKTLKRGAKATANLFTASRGKATDWYKFKVTKLRDTDVWVDARQIKSGELYVTCYNGSKKIGDTKKVYAGQKSEFEVTNSTRWGKAKAGTYYIKIVKSSKANGKYTVRYRR